MPNAKLMNVAAICIILATAYAAVKEVVGHYAAEQARSDAAIADAKAIIDQTVNR